MSSDLDADDYPERIQWRIARAIDELGATEFPDPPRDLEHARRIIGVAVLIVSPEQVPILGELGKCEWRSQFAPVPENGDWFDKLLEANRQGAEPGPHARRPTQIDSRRFGREEVLFNLGLSGGRELKHQWGDLSQFTKLLQHATAIWTPTLTVVSEEAAVQAQYSAPVSNGVRPLPPAALRAGQEYELAQSKSNVQLTDKQAYEYVREHVTESPDELPAYEAWERYVRTYRKARGAQKNHPRAGRSAGARSVVSANMIEGKPD